VTAKQRLVVVGNGMAGARLVEEVVARGGRELFEIDVFGDEPYGNYNRILLSSVLAGGHQPEDIFLNSLSWYEERVMLHAGVRVGWIDRLSKCVYAPGGVTAPYDKLVIATGSSPFVPRMDGLGTEEGTFKQGVFVFRTLDDCTEIIATPLRHTKLR
jgi:nitrite reductase (NADH) large subunit